MLTYYQILAEQAERIDVVAGRPAGRRRPRVVNAAFDPNYDPRKDRSE